MKTVYFINSISFLEFYCNALTYNEIDENVKDKKKCLITKLLITSNTTLSYINTLYHTLTHVYLITSDTEFKF